MSNGCKDSCVFLAGIGEARRHFRAETLQEAGPANKDHLLDTFRRDTRSMDSGKRLCANGFGRRAEFSVKHLAGKLNA